MGSEVSGGVAPLTGICVNLYPWIWGGPCVLDAAGGEGGIWGRVKFTALLYSLAQVTVWLGLLSLLFVPLERLAALHPQKIIRRAFWTDLGYYFLSSLLPTLVLSLPVAMLALATNLIIPGSFQAFMARMPIWGRIVLGLVVSDLGYYAWHRLSHRVPFLWRFHAIHHSAESMDFLVNTRAHPVDLILGRFAALIPMYLLGLAGPVVEGGTNVAMVVKVIGTAWTYFIHANVKWRFGFLERLISTPAFHHWHHTLEGPIDRNFSAMMPWIDWLFGSYFVPANEWPKAYGVPEKVPQNLVEQVLYPLMEPTDSPADPSDPSGGGPRSA